MTKYRIGDLGRVVTGRTPPSSKPECFGEEFPFITPSDMDDRKTIRTTERYLSTSGYSLLRSNLLPPKCVAVSCIGWQMGKSALTSRPSFTNQQLNSVIPDHNRVDADYLYYALTTRREEFKRLGSVGTRTPILNKSAFCALEVELPDLATQRRIAALLSAYDDLIENNTRRIKILEDMAQMLYREWFVNFRFPGHEKVRMVESELGSIPEGWKRSDFGSLSINLDSKRIPLSSMQRASHDRRYPYYGASGIIDQVEAYLFDGLHLLVSEDGENLRSRKTPIAFLADGKFWVNNHAHIVQGKAPVSTEYLFAILKNADISPYITGTAQPKLSQSNLNRIPVLLPNDSVLGMFDELYAPLLSLINNCGRKNANLRTTRDLLLPKLISGEISIEAADEAAAELMEQTA